MDSVLTAALSDSLTQFSNRIREAYEPIFNIPNPCAGMIETINQISHSILSKVITNYEQQQISLYNDIHESMQESLKNISQSIALSLLDFQIPIIAENFAKQLNEQYTELFNSVIEQWNKIPLDIRNAIFTAPDTNTPYSKSPVFKDAVYAIADNISIESNHVSISLDAVEQIAAVTGVKPQLENECSNNSGPIKISLKNFFLTILYPLILMIIPMMQSQYQYEQNALESDLQQFEEHVSENRRLKLEEQQLVINQAILDFLQTFLTDLDNLQESVDDLQESVDDLQESIQRSSSSESPTLEPPETIQSENGSI